MNKRLFPRICLVIPLITSFLFMPVNTVNAAGYSTDADFWRWWYIEHQTDAITDGQGASAENIQNTDSGQTAGTVIYNQSGVTRGDFIDYVEEQYNQAEGYLQKGVEYYVDCVNHVYDSTVTVATKAAYQTEKAVREVVDSTGNVIVDVSGSDFWHSVYNDLFNSQSYEHQYTTTNDSMSGTSGTHNYTITFIGTYQSDMLQYTYNDNGVFQGNYYLSWQTTTRNDWNCIFKVVDNGNTYYYPVLNSGSDTSNFWHFEGFLFTQQYVRATFTRADGGNNSLQDFYFRINNGSNTGVSSGTAVQEPYSVGFINYNGEKHPIYKDKDLNGDLTVNDNGTVTDENGNDYPIYIDPSELTDDGWLKILEYIDNEDETQSPYNPQGKPWNTQDDGTVLGGLFSDLISDISSIFNDIADKIKSFFDGIIDKIVNALKKFIVDFIGDLDINSMTDLDVTNPFNLISECFDILLESLGVV